MPLLPQYQNQYRNNILFSPNPLLVPPNWIPSGSGGNATVSATQYTPPNTGTGGQQQPLQTTGAPTQTTGSPLQTTGAPTQTTGTQTQTMGGMTTTNVPPDVVSRQYIRGQASGLETAGGGALTKGLIAGGLDTLGGLLQSKLAQRLVPDISKASSQLSKDFQQNLENVAKMLQTNQLGDIGTAAATRAQLAYQQSLATPQAISNLAKAEAAAKSLESLGAAAVGQAISALDKDRRAAMMALARSGATPGMMIGALQRMGAESGGRTQDIINAAVQQGIQASAQAQNLRNQALNALMEQQQLSYQTKVVPTLNQFQFGPLAQLAGMPLQTASEAISHNYVIPQSPLAPLAQILANESANQSMFRLTADALRKGIIGSERDVFGKEYEDIDAAKRGALKDLANYNQNLNLQSTLGGGGAGGTGGGAIPGQTTTVPMGGNPLWMQTIYRPMNMPNYSVFGQPLFSNARNNTGVI